MVDNANCIKSLDNMGRAIHLSLAGNERGWLALRLAVYAAIVLALAVTWGGAFPLDDAYITLHNARVLLEGADPYYNTSALTGATSGVHLALLALLGLAMPLPEALILLCATGGFAYLWGIDLLVRKMGVEGWKVPALVTIGFTAGTVPHLLMNGLETGIAMAAAAWLLVLADDRRLALLAGLAPFIRPELGLLAALLMLRQMRELPWQESARRIAIAALAAAPWALWYFIELGTPIPNTIAAKAAFFTHEQWRIGFRIALLLIVVINFYFAAILLGLFGLPGARAGWECLAFIIIFIAVALITVPGSLNWNVGRYLAPLIPALVVGFAALANKRSGGVLLLLVAGFGLALVPENWTSLQKIRADFRTEAISTRKNLVQLPKDTIVLIHDAGMPSWVQPPVKLIDVVGLKTPASIGAHERLTHDMCKWGKALDEIARSTRAEYLYYRKVDFWECVPQNLAGEGWSLAALPEHGGEFRLYRISPPAIPRVVNNSAASPANNTSATAENDTSAIRP